ncbi:hypothetical protein BsWGS_07150 [Bradybaena similaris]
MSQTFGASQGTLEERFSYLLQPIRDLAKNWDVDIAHFLEEYLEDLEKIEITFDDGATTMNFSEAALLIQGSAGVYAKKVEYLYSLVFQVLDLVTQKKKSKSGSGEDGADDAGDNGDANEQFLPLDDIPNGDGSYTKEQDITTNKSIRPVPEMPTRLIPLEELEKGDNCLYNKKGEVMGNHCDFNVDIGYISTDGSLLLEMGDKMLQSMAFQQRQTLQAIAEEQMNVSAADGDFALPAADDADIEDPLPVDFEDGPRDGGDAQNNTENPVESVVTRPQRKRVTFTRPQTKPKQDVDPWALLDPYEKSKAVEKPLKKKKPFRIPACLDTNKKRKKVKVKVELPPIYEVVDKLFSHKQKFPKNPMKVPDFPELEEAFWQEYKHREEIKKELKKEEKELVETVEDEDGDADFDDHELQRCSDDIEEDDIPPLQLDAQLFGDHINNRWTGAVNAGSNILFGDDMTMSYEDLVQKHVEKFLASAAEYAQITELSRRVTEWEEKIRPKLEEQDGHGPFDIHKYGTFIIESLVRGEMRAYREIVGGKPEYEICRYTLATLQLANVYNVELTIIPDISGNIMDCLYVTLLSTKRHFEDLEDYRAPSLK